ncbi:MAG: response regulator [Eubacteriales bacterium]|nr:response regulator [Eubacteriales bacterium]
MITVLIADDEVLHCEAVEHMLDGLFPEVKVLPSVYDGLVLVQQVEKEEPDIIIVDVNMPGLSGLEAIEILNSKNIRMEIIVHTAYSKFDYIHSALKLGASDFLVKPVFEDDFREAFSRVLKKVEDKKQISGMQISKNMSWKVNEMLETNIMMSFLLHKPDVKGWKLFAEKYPCGKGAGIIAAFHINEHQKQKTVFPVLVSRLKNYCCCLSLLYEDKLYCYLLPGKEMDSEGGQAWIKGWLDELLNGFSRKFDLEIRVGLSCWKDNFDQMPEAVVEAEIALQNEAEKRISFYKTEQKELVKNPFLNSVGSVAAFLEEDEADKAMAEIIFRLEDGQQDSRVRFPICFYAEELLVNAALLLRMERRRTGTNWTIQERLGRLVRENSEKGIWGELITADTCMEKNEFLMHIKSEIKELASDLKRPVRKSNQYVEKALLYMDKNYMQDISLESTAEQIGITQFYLSRLFKQERNETFLDILTDIRISQAIRLMKEPSRTVVNISALTGYTVKYFYRVFKSATGISQKEFRDALYVHREGDN